MVKKLLIYITFFISFIFANSSLESKIAKLQTVPKSQRYKLMNQIKKELATMNKKQRTKVLNKLKASIHSSKSYMKSSSVSVDKRGGNHMNSSHMKSNMQHIINKNSMHEHMNMSKKSDWTNKLKSPTKPSIPTKPFNPFEHNGNNHSGPKKGQHGK